LHLQLRWMHVQGPYVPELGPWLAGRAGGYDVVIFFTYLYYTTWAGLPAAPRAPPHRPRRAGAVPPPLRHDLPPPERLRLLHRGGAGAGPAAVPLPPAGPGRGHRRRARRLGGGGCVALPGRLRARRPALPALRRPSRPVQGHQRALRLLRGLQAAQRRPAGAGADGRPRPAPRRPRRR